MKPCRKCGKILPLLDFYTHSSTADGHLNICKNCTKESARANRAAKIGYYQEYDRKRAMLPKRVQMRARYQETEEGKLSNSNSKKKYIRNNPTKRTAHNAVSNAVRDGRLIKLPCEVCGSTNRIHGHHDDYSKPLEVRWLCPKHHRLAHVG